MNAYIWTITSSMGNLYRATFEDAIDMKVRYHGKSWLDLESSGDFDVRMADAMSDCHQMIENEYDLSGEENYHVIIDDIKFTELNLDHI